jgi:uncharacterized protein YndB with AHSA1/START domain
MEQIVFNYGIYINATPEQVWEALTKSEFTSRYWGGRIVESDWQEGSPIMMTKPGSKPDFHGKVLRVEKPNLLSFSGIGGQSAIVTFEITEVAKGEIKLVITHAVDNEGIRNSIREGWYAIMSSLKTMLETGKELDHSWWTR